MFFWALRVQAKTDLLHRLDADAYSSEEVLVLSVPLSLPYPIFDANYQRANGEVEYKGEFYQLVKQRIENDTLFMVCVKDHRQKHLKQTMNEYTNLANNLPASTKHTMDLLGKLFKDFTGTSFSIPSKTLAVKYNILYALNDAVITQQTLSIDSPPPELI
jgi:hypothetical protein